MTRICLITMLLATAVAQPALAHPGHGMPGWLHHGEAFAAAMVLGGLLVWRRVSGRASRRRDS